uniref:Uncharacterized protein n=1 Tax=Lactuca sativa TaxID=4236 RepID=A0A9R1VNB5_LACSA|nr:hypothetical protein LSAT_V11C400227900 [Lactuca sativa]
MFSLFYGLWKYLVNKTEFQLLILGIDKARKTVIISLLFHYYILLFNIGRIETSNTKLVFWDLGGQEAYVVLFVVDASCPSRFEDSKSALVCFHFLLSELRLVDLSVDFFVLAKSQNQHMMPPYAAFYPHGGVYAHPVVHLVSLLDLSKIIL